MNPQSVMVTLQTMHGYTQISISTREGQMGEQCIVTYPITFREACQWGTWANDQKRGRKVFTVLTADGWVMSLDADKIRPCALTNTAFYDIQRRLESEVPKYIALNDKLGFRLATSTGSKMKGAT